MTDEAAEQRNQPDADAAQPALIDAPAAAPGGGAYRVLARKYRPATFDELIGQDAMVRTLTNAFAAGRIAQAYMLTGVRGVGKTTTARILARALNYEIDGSDTGPTVAMPQLGVHCAAIMESRHPDVFEMDAASNTGIDDIREIIGYAQTRPSMARYKVFIVDEVHMLSRQAFNGLLKTLEEPPEHARFIFATTEVRKVPVTVLSRCQRFDLRRVDGEVLMAHFADIAAREGVEVEPAALGLIARAAEGSVRDGLSLLDQAIALAGSAVAETDVRAMLGLADRVRVIDLFDQVMRGDVAAALGELKDQYDSGADPLVVLADLAQFVHLVTRAKVSDALVADPSLAQVEREKAQAFAGLLSMSALARAWQMLLKGHREVETARNPLAAAEMVLVRLAHASGLPSPEEVIRGLHGAPGEPQRPAPAPVNGGSASGASEAAAHAPAPQSFEEAARLVGDHDIRLIDLLERSVRPVSFAQGHIEVALTDDAPADIANRFAATLTLATGTRWVVSVAGSGGGETLREAQARGAAELEAEIGDNPVVRQVKSLFPGAEVVAVRDMPSSQAADAGEDDEAAGDGIGQSA